MKLFRILGDLVRGRRRSPFEAVLLSHGLTLPQARKAAGTGALHAAAASCRSCRASEECRRALRSGWCGFDVRCPNAAFFRRIAAEHFFLEWCKKVP